jgi:sec-independent protein translocase protein TatA
MTAHHAPVLGAFLGTTEIIIILFIVLLLFGAKKLPELAKGLGKSVNEFKKASKDAEAEEEQRAAADSKVASAKSAESAKPHGNN